MNEEAWRVVESFDWERRGSGAWGAPVIARAAASKSAGIANGEEEEDKGVLDPASVAGREKGC